MPLTQWVQDTLCQGTKLAISKCLSGLWIILNGNNPGPKDSNRNLDPLPNCLEDLDRGSRFLFESFGPGLFPFKIIHRPERHFEMASLVP